MQKPSEEQAALLGSDSQPGTWACAGDEATAPVKLLRVPRGAGPIKYGCSPCTSHQGGAFSPRVTSSCRGRGCSVRESRHRVWEVLQGGDSGCIRLEVQPRGVSKRNKNQDSSLLDCEGEGGTVLSQETKREPRGGRSDSSESGHGLC